MDSRSLCHYAKRRVWFVVPNWQLPPSLSNPTEDKWHFCCVWVPCVANSQSEQPRQSEFNEMNKLQKFCSLASHIRLRACIFKFTDCGRRRALTHTHSWVAPAVKLSDGSNNAFAIFSAVHTCLKKEQGINQRAQSDLMIEWNVIILLFDKTHYVTMKPVRISEAEARFHLQRQSLSRFWKSKK